MIIPAKQAIQEITDLMNKELAEMPDDETRQAVLDVFSKQMFCDTRKVKNDIPSR
jgi:hypothetical protein